MHILAQPDAQSLRESSRTSLFTARYDRALDAIRRLEDLAEAGAEEYHNMAVAHYKRGESENAEVAVRVAIARDPRRRRRHYLLGLILKDRGELQEAESAFSEVLERDPDFGKAWFQRGATRHYRGDLEGAEQDLRRAVALLPDLLWAHYNLGVVAVARRDWDQASRAFQRCIELDRLGREDYCELLRQIGRAEAAEELYHHAHRLKNLVGLAGNRLRLFAGRVRAALPAAEHEELEGIRAEQERIYTDMVGYLNTMNPRPPRYDLVDLNGLLERCLFAASAALEGVTVTRALDGALPEVVCDPAAIQEALLNLILNAADAIAADAATGTVRGQVHLSTARIDEDTVSISVADTGRGIPPQELGRVFDLGFTTKPAGSGIGLAQVRRAILAHGGRVEVHSEPGRGTGFTVLLPVRLPGHVDLRNLAMRSLLFEDMHDLVDIPTGEEELML